MGERGTARTVVRCVIGGLSDGQAGPPSRAAWPRGHVASGSGVAASYWRARSPSCRCYHSPPRASLGGNCWLWRRVRRPSGDTRTPDRWQPDEGGAHRAGGPRSRPHEEARRDHSRHPVRRHCQGAAPRGEGRTPRLRQLPSPVPRAAPGPQPQNRRPGGRAVEARRLLQAGQGSEGADQPEPGAAGPAGTCRSRPEPSPPPPRRSWRRCGPTGATPSTARTGCLHMERFAFPRLGKLPVSEVTSADVSPPTGVVGRPVAAAGTAGLRLPRRAGMGGAAPR